MNDTFKKNGGVRESSNFDYPLPNTVFSVENSQDFGEIISFLPLEVLKIESKNEQMTMDRFSTLTQSVNENCIMEFEKVVDKNKEILMKHVTQKKTFKKSAKEKTYNVKFRKTETELPLAKLVLQCCDVLTEIFSFLPHRFVLQILARVCWLFNYSAMHTSMVFDFFRRIPEKKFISTIMGRYRVGGLRFEKSTDESTRLVEQFKDCLTKISYSGTLPEKMPVLPNLEYLHVGGAVNVDFLEKCGKLRSLAFDFSCFSLLEDPNSEEFGRFLRFLSTDRLQELLIDFEGCFSIEKRQQTQRRRRERQRWNYNNQTQEQDIPDAIDSLVADRLLGRVSELKRLRKLNWPMEKHFKFSESFVDFCFETQLSELKFSYYDNNNSFYKAVKTFEFDTFACNLQRVDIFLTKKSLVFVGKIFCLPIALTLRSFLSKSDVFNRFIQCIDFDTVQIHSFRIDQKVLYVEVIEELSCLFNCTSIKSFRFGNFQQNPRKKKFVGCSLILDALVRIFELCRQSHHVERLEVNVHEDGGAYGMSALGSKRFINALTLLFSTAQSNLKAFYLNSAVRKTGSYLHRRFFYLHTSSYCNGISYDDLLRNERLEVDMRRKWKKEDGGDTPKRKLVIGSPFRSRRDKIYVPKKFAKEKVNLAPREAVDIENFYSSLRENDTLEELFIRRSFSKAISEHVYGIVEK